jgi:multicomponent Na+:H+ antiporter subunit F
MTTYILAIAIVLMASIVVGLIRVAIGPTASDRMMAAQLMGTSGIGVTLLMAHIIGIMALVDVALVFSLLAAVAITAFTRRRIDEAGD